MKMILEMEGVTRQRDDKLLLDGIDWQVRKGQHWVLYGLNGTGKH